VVTSFGPKIRPNEPPLSPRQIRAVLSVGRVARNQMFSEPLPHLDLAAKNQLAPKTSVYQLTQQIPP
jgi:hypothetical protein